MTKPIPRIKTGETFGQVDASTVPTLPGTYLCEITQNRRGETRRHCGCRYAF
jgi:hypothetical protein